MDALSLQGFLKIGTAGTLVAAIIGICCCGLGGELSAEDLPIVGLLSVFAGFVVAGVCYLVQLIRDLDALHLAPEELLDGEIVFMETPGSIVHFRSGRASRLWDGVGGRLILTSSQRLVFLGASWATLAISL